MPDSIKVDRRTAAVTAFLSTKDRSIVTKALRASDGDWPTARLSLGAKLAPDRLARLDLAHTLADWSGDNKGVVKALADQPGLNNLRDVALRYDAARLAETIRPADVPDTAPGDTPQARVANYAAELHSKLFAMQTSAVLQRMAQDKQLPIADDTIRVGVAKFLDGMPDFDIRRTSIYTALQTPDALAGVPEDRRADVIDHLKTLQRVQALAPTAAAVPVLMQANLTAALHVTEMPQTMFMRSYGDALGPAVARQVYANAVDVRVRNEQALATLRDVVHGTGFGLIDGNLSLADRLSQLQVVADRKGAPISLASLVGGLDYCECDDCLSVTSPAAYFVEILQYLRNNNLDPSNPNTGVKGIAGTAVEQLFRRRPDLKCLELTCANTFTVLPYVDLVNEVMESFVVHAHDYAIDPNVPKQATLDVFNIDDETTSELLATPQHVNYQAYCILKNAVYPFTLPYHQPIDAIRIYLQYAGTSRYELLDVCRRAHEPALAAPPLSPADVQELQTTHEAALTRATEAELLGLTQEEYILLTREAFWPKRYFELTQQAVFTDDAYRAKIGVKAVHEYYGYGAEADLLSLDESQAKGLTFVKKQFLPRTGVSYVELVDLLQTRAINPNFPQGPARTLMESLHASYRAMQLLVDHTSADPTVRFGKLIDFLVNVEGLLPLLEARLHPDPCHARPADQGCCSTEGMRREITRWVRCYFERVGKLIVLESGEGPTLSVYGPLYTSPGQKHVADLKPDGTIVTADGKIIGRVGFDGKVLAANGKPFTEEFGQGFFWINDPTGKAIGFLNSDGVHSRNERAATWRPARDTCDLDKVRLTHLDGTPVTIEEYDRIQRFIRLWRKTGWQIQEVDYAVSGKSGLTLGVGAGGTSPAGTSDAQTPAYVTFDAFADDCSAGPDDHDGGGCCCDGEGGLLRCPDEAKADFDITPDTVRQLGAIQQLIDLTGLPLIRLLSFWAEIDTHGEKSLYAKLFLTHNLVAIDGVFKADANGDFLVGNARLSDHLPVLMAALRLSAADIAAVVALRNLPDALTLANVSTLYRHGLLAKLLHVKAADLAGVVAVFGDPLTSPADTLDFLRRWGRLTDAGFTFRQIDYVVRGHDDLLRPLAPTLRKTLQLARTLHDGLTAIDSDHPDVSDGTDPAVDDAAAVSDDAVRAKAGLLFGSADVDRIIGLLDGTTLYTTNAPINLTITVPEPLVKKVAYDNRPTASPPAATLLVTSALTPAEVAQAKALSASPGWAAAVDRVGKQTANVFNDVLSGVFPDANAAKAVLFAGDVTVPADTLDPSLPDPNTAPAKRRYFMRAFMPFLRERLAHRLVVDTMSAAVGLNADVTDVLLSEVLHGGTPAQPALEILEALKKSPAVNPAEWKGYVLAPAADAYAFVAVSDTPPAAMELDGQSVPFLHQQDDPSNVWFSDPVPLKAGVPLSVRLVNLSPAQLSWKTPSSGRAPVPATALLPDDTTQAMSDTLVTLKKLAIVIGGLDLNAPELAYLQAHAADFHGLDFNALTMTAWERLLAYVTLRDTLPKQDVTLLDLFAWAAKPGVAAELIDRVVASTGWKADAVAAMLETTRMDAGRPDAFMNEIVLTRMQRVLRLSDKTGMNVKGLFDWADPTSSFWRCHAIAGEIRNALHSRFDETDWEKVVGPLNDQLRDNQRKALIAYLLVQPALIDWGVVDADSLFEFFLIDVQMGTCLKTSRIKQAISTVQLYVQRCMLGLEMPYVATDTLDRERWEWMQRYRVWEANRKVFLYPENWIRPEWRDDKSPFYKELESELLQKDIDEQSVQEALQNYLFKVDDVANLHIVGLHVEFDANKTPTLLHVFGRTRHAPYFFFYRWYDVAAQNWYPWEKMQVDIPTYDFEYETSQKRKRVLSGVYLAPVVWNKRLLVFFPQFIKKTTTNPTADKNKIKDSGDSTPQQTQPFEYWEIKLAWSERQNNKWTAKRVSAAAILDDPNVGNANATPNALPAVNNYQFVPRLIGQEPPNVIIDVYFERLTQAVGRFTFTGNALVPDLTAASVLPITQASEHVDTSFHYRNDSVEILASLQDVGHGAQNDLILRDPQFSEYIGGVTISGEGASSNFFHPFVHRLVGKLAAGGLDDMYDTFAAVTDRADAYGGDAGARYHELKRPYSIYNWEVGLHAAMAISAKHRDARQYDLSLAMHHHVFDPTAPGTDSKRFWHFPPFKEINAANVLEDFFLGLQPGQPNAAINEWRDKPFQPHVVARSRPSAYMKWVVKEYIKTLAAQGDDHFRKNTLEFIPMAIQCYVLALHIHGPQGQKIPKRGKIKPETYLSLLDRWDAFGNAMVELELAFPFSNQTPMLVGTLNDGSLAMPNIFGFATSLYFCIPPNPQVAELREMIEDRLYKIRHCQDINGVYRDLPLFEPPIDPELLVAAAAQGLSLSSVLNDLDAPMPNYRFYYLLQKALELCAEVKSLGMAFLSAKEKKDTETVANLRAAHDTAIQTLMMEVRTRQLQEAEAAIDALQESRKGPVYRLQHHLKLLGEDIGKVPDGDTDFAELADSIEAPVDESGLKLGSYEREEMSKASAAADWQTAVGIAETLAGVFHALPIINTHATPIGCGLAVCWGPPHLGHATGAVARGLKIHGDNLAYQSSNAGRKAGFLRQFQDRTQAANTAGYEIKHIDKQILAQQIRINIAQQEIDNQQKQIDNAQEVEDFLRNKYTNEDHYDWQVGQLKTLHHQAFTLAYDLARRAEKAFRFHRGLTKTDFIPFGLWDAGHDGLMAGERLQISLKQMEAAYQADRGWDFEIPRPISLRQVNPLALLQLRQTGRCEFALPEVLFDMDYPGHYQRRIKAVSVTMPCVVGPYASLNCTLRLLDHRFRTSSLVRDKNDYPQHADGDDDRFTTLNVPITSIAVANGQNDAGLFELNFHDERCLPFEGAGVISTWRLELPDPAFAPFDYDTISDVVLNLRYTSIDGGDKLKGQAAESVKAYVKSIEELDADQGLFAAFDLRHDFPNEWYDAMQSAPVNGVRTITIARLYERLPFFTKGRKPAKIQATDVYYYVSADAMPSSVTLTQGGDDTPLNAGPDVGDMKLFSAKEMDGVPMDNWQISIKTAGDVKKTWIVMRYTLL